MGQKHDCFAGRNSGWKTLQIIPQRRTGDHSRFRFSTLRQIFENLSFFDCVGCRRSGDFMIGCRITLPSATAGGRLYGSFRNSGRELHESFRNVGQELHETLRNSGRELLPFSRLFTLKQIFFFPNFEFFTVFHRFSWAERNVTPVTASWRLMQAHATTHFSNTILSCPHASCRQRGRD